MAAHAAREAELDSVLSALAVLLQCHLAGDGGRVAEGERASCSSGGEKVGEKGPSASQVVAARFPDASTPPLLRFRAS
jgi:hypothetical protein